MSEHTDFGIVTVLWADRVKPPVVDGTVERRRSAAYFHDGDPAAVVAPLTSCVDADHPPLYDPVTIDAHIREAGGLARGRAQRGGGPGG